MKLFQIKNIFLLIFTLFVTNKLVAQDVMFSQFYANPLYLAPSFAGASKLGSRFALNYRDQWPVVPKAFRTYTVSFDHYFDKIRSGMGLFFLRDNAGSANLNTTHIGYLYSYDFQITEEWHIRPGINFYYIQTGIDYNRLVAYEQLFDESSPVSTFVPPLELNSDVDFNTSVIAYNELYWGGLTMSHFLKPDIFFYNNNYLRNQSLFSSLKYSVFAGAKVRLRGNLLKFYKESLTLALLYEQMDKYRQLNLGTYYHLNPLLFGVWYRGIPFIKGNPGHDALVFLVGYQISDYINLGYSYDFTISSLKPTSGGAHEISLVWNFKVKDRHKKPTSLPCPDF
jgi:type IX secretion system PorP/SprF family membrane protein